jgi:hypothetical protein
MEKPGQRVLLTGLRTLLVVGPCPLADDGQVHCHSQEAR